MKKIASFDVFDTLLTRVVGDPKSLFLFLGRILKDRQLIPCSAEAFARLRMEAEKRAHERVGDGFSFSDIYVALSHALNLDPEMASLAMKTECKLEDELVRPLPGAYQMVSEARGRVGRVVFISDMYLSSKFIRTLLLKYGFWKDGDKCYVSCEVGAFKRSGLLRMVCEKEGIKPSEMCHIGNNKINDVGAAKREGIDSTLTDRGNLNRYETILESHTWMTEGFSSLLAGASRLARLGSGDIDSERFSKIRDVAAGVVAPALVSFAIWVLRNAELRRLKRLCFVSRDGQILCEIFKRLAAKLEIAIECKYLFGSRYAWSMAAVTTGSERQLDWVFDNTDHLSIRLILSRVRLTRKQIEEEIEKIGFRECDWDRNLYYSERKRFRKIFENVKVRGLVLSIALKERDLVQKYLIQEGLMDPIPWGFVDVGWFGTLQSAMGGILPQNVPFKPAGYYFGFYPCAQSNEFGDRKGFYFNGEDGFCQKTLWSVIEMMEMFSSADHGTVVGFKRDPATEKIVPLLKCEQNLALIEWGLTALRDTVFRFIDALELTPSLVNTQVGIKQALNEVLCAFRFDPNKEEAKVWGSFPWEDGVATKSVVKCPARPYKGRDLIRVLKSGEIKRHRAEWVEGSMVLTNRGTRFLLKMCMKVSRPLSFLIPLVYRGIGLNRLRSLLRGLKFQKQAHAINLERVKLTT